MNGYSSAAAARLAGLSYRQLDYMTRMGVVEPSLPSTTISGGRLFGIEGGSGTARRWSERDVRLLRVLATLRGNGLSHERLRDVALRLRGHDLESGWLVVSMIHVEPCADIRKLGTMVAAMAPAHVVELHPLDVLAA